MTEDELWDKIEKWDLIKTESIYDKISQDPAEHKKNKSIERYHEDIYSKIEFFASYFLDNYDLDASKDFIKSFFNWLGQFSGRVGIPGNHPGLDEEDRYAFILAHKIIFLDRHQIIALLREIWDKIKQEFLKIAAKQKGVSLLSLMFEENPISDQLYKSVFVPLSDSSHFQEFRHQCLPPGKSEELSISSIGELLLAFELKTEKEKIINKYSKNENLFIIEDFSGSGTSIERRVKPIIDKYHFKNIYFCPCIITDKALENLRRLKTFALKKNKNFEVIYGLRLDQTYSILNENSGGIWTEEEKEAMRKMSEKYFDSHFRDNGNLYWKVKGERKPTPYGFRNCGLAVVLFTNCPNNSLPLLWSQGGGWHPLFPRHERD